MIGSNSAGLTSEMTSYHNNFAEPEVQPSLSTCIIKSVIMSEFFQFLALSFLS